MVISIYLYSRGCLKEKNSYTDIEIKKKQNVKSGYHYHV
jgi:hypothetical protein